MISEIARKYGDIKQEQVDELVNAYVYCYNVKTKSSAIVEVAARCFTVEFSLSSGSVGV